MSLLSSLFGVKSAGSPLVLRRYSIDERGKFLVDIVGRQSGIVAWILVTMGLDVETKLQVTRQSLSFKASSFFGTNYNTIPLTAISSTHCGYTKSAAALFAAIFFVGAGFVQFLSGAGGLAIILLVIAAFCFVSYWLSKTLTIFIETNGGTMIGLAFKRSLIENVQVDIDEALRTITLINRAVLSAQSLSSDVAA